MLAWFGNFLGRPRSCFTGARDAKVAEADLAVYSIKRLSTGDIFI